MALISREVSIHRMLTFIFALFGLSIGWLLYTIGLCWELRVWTGEVDTEQGPYDGYNMSRSDSSLFPYYITLVGGPFLFLFEVLHAVLPGVASSVFGAISIFVSSFYFVSVGDVAVRSGFNISHTLYETQRSQFPPHPHIPVSPRVALRFSGVVIECLSWTIILIVSQFYRRRSVTVYRNMLWPLSLGYARLASVVCIVCSAIGWCVYVAGKHSVEIHDIHGVPVRIFGLYTLNEAGTFLVPPLLFIAALLYAGCAGDAGILIGVFLSILHMLFVVFMGSAVISSSLAMHGDLGCIQGINCNAVKQIIGGGVTSLFFWMLAMSLRPFYHQRSSETPPNSSQQQFYTVREDEQPHETQPLIQRK